MIKREWFISVEVIKGNARTISWRQWWSRCFFSNPKGEIEYIEKLIAGDLGVKAEDISIISFNRV